MLRDGKRQSGSEHNMVVTMALIISAMSSSFTKQNSHGVLDLADEIKKE